MWNPTDELLDAVLHRPLARPFVWIFYPTPLTPDGVSALSALAGIGAAVLIAGGSAADMVIAGALIELMIVLDCADGQLARARGGGTPHGRIVDGVCDYVAGLALHLGLLSYLLGHPTDLAPSSLFAVGLVALSAASMAIHSAVLDLFKGRFLHRNDRLVPPLGGGIGRIAASIYRAYLKMQSAFSGSGRPPAWLLRALSFAGPTTRLTTLAVCCALAPWAPEALDLFFLFGIGACSLYVMALMAVERALRRRVEWTP